MEAILHIGMPKTGTTVIQRSLMELSHRRGRGSPFCYPLVAGTGHAHTHLIVLDQKNSLPAFLQWRYSPQASARRKEGAAMLAELERQIAGSKADTCILSTEAWFSRPYLLSDEFFVDFLGRNFSSVRIICYTRRPSSYYVSALQQRLKRSPELLPLASPKFSLVAQRCRNIAEPEMVAFEAATSTSGGIVADFLDRAGIEIKSDLPQLDAFGSNQGFSAEAVMLLWEHRLQLPVNRHHRMSPEDAEFIAQLRNAEAAMGRAEVRPRLRERFANWLDRTTVHLEYLRRSHRIDYTLQGTSPPEDDPRPDFRSLDELLWVDPDVLRELRRRMQAQIRG